MAISFTKYIDITSGIIAGNGVRQRDLITRIYSTNPLIPTNNFAEFDNSDEVIAYFGSGATESLMAEKYFSFISKTTTKPKKISFASWVDANSAPLIYGARGGTQTLAQLNTISSGHLALTLGDETHTLTGIDLSGAANLAAVAAIIQTHIRAGDVDVQWSAATVSYNGTTGTFNLVGGATVSGSAPVSVQSSTPDVGTAIGWRNVNTVFSYGSGAKSLTDTMINSVAASNNFGTFTFIPELDENQIVELATWNATQNNMFIFEVPVDADNASDISAALIDFPGCAMTLEPLSDEYPRLFPGMILAATDYTRRNASQNYMFQVAGFTPSVVTDADSDAYDLLRVNYYGETQEAGQLIKFYQRGVLTGLPVSPSDMNIYANEMWFKDAVGDDFMALLLAVNQISTNNAGRARLITTILSRVETALFNGTISSGTILNNEQIAAITDITGDPRAYHQVQSIGYWLDVNFQSYVTLDSRTEWKAVYTLVYKKNDAIRKIEGAHNLV